MGSKYWTLLTAATSQSKNICPFQRREPFFGNSPDSCQRNIQRSVFSSNIIFMTDSRCFIKETFIYIVPSVRIETDIIYVVHVIHRVMLNKTF